MGLIGGSAATPAGSVGPRMIGRARRPCSEVAHAEVVRRHIEQQLDRGQSGFTRGAHNEFSPFIHPPATMLFALELALVLGCLFYGARKGGIALGLLGGLGLVILAFAFKLPPGKPPVD